MARYRSAYDGERRSKSLRSWVTPEEYDAITRAAAEAGAGLSDYVRQLCTRNLSGERAAAGQQRSAAAKLIADELHSLGMTLTRMTAEAAADKRSDAALLETMGALKAALARVIAL